MEGHSNRGPRKENTIKRGPTKVDLSKGSPNKGYNSQEGRRPSKKQKRCTQCVCWLSIKSSVKCCRYNYSII